MGQRIDVLESLRVAIAPYGFHAERIPGEKSGSVYLRVNGKRCRVHAVQTRVSHARVIISHEMMTNPEPVVIRVGGDGEYEWYVFRKDELTRLARDQGYLRGGAGSGQSFHIPHPHKPDSKFEPFRNGWDRLA
jgi:hypothetical protein